MRITRFLDEHNSVCFGTDIEKGMATLLTDDVFGEIKKIGKRVKVKKTLPPLNPVAIFCVGINYKAHAAETGMKLPEYPIVFMKNPASVIGHHMPIVLPASCRDPLQVDYEVELAVIIGKEAKNVSVDKALDYVAGYTIANDVSARTWQANAGARQWIRGKSFDTFCPLGPDLITREDVADPDNLNLECRLNGKVMQQSNTADMIFSTSELIAYLSEDTTLLPGTVILTGTPSGVGFTRNPPVFLTPGDEIRMTIEKLGVLINTVK